MTFVSTSGRAPTLPFRDVIFSGLAPDGGLYVPATFPSLPQELLQSLPLASLQQIGEAVASAYIDDIPREDLGGILARAWTFPIPLVQLADDLYLLELFHGPTLAFKDIGVRFLAQVLSHYLQRTNGDLTILVATSGDTGSAVAHGFFNVPRITVYVFYPSGKISRLQEQQMATLGGNIHALEIDGTFDDCQVLVKQVLGDSEILEARAVTTANSISLGRLVPQIAYYFWAIAQWQSKFRGGVGGPDPTMVVPTGNFGNLTAGVYARLMGAPIAGFVAATNANDAGACYLQTGVFSPRRAIPTCSNAMDVGNPSNLARLRHLFEEDLSLVRRHIKAMVVGDDATLETIRNVHQQTGIVIDPHTAVGVAAARGCPSQKPMVVTATAHPGKFPEIIERALGIRIPLPEPLAEALGRPKQSLPFKADFAAVKRLLLSTA
jgi:threonine synthase